MVMARLRKERHNKEHNSDVCVTNTTTKKRKKEKLDSSQLDDKQNVVPKVEAKNPSIIKTRLKDEVANSNKLITVPDAEPRKPWSVLAVKENEARTWRDQGHKRMQEESRRKAKFEEQGYALKPKGEQGVEERRCREGEVGRKV